MKKPIVTIGICVKNAEKTVIEAIKSILRQDFPLDSVELICVDDGSEDNTLLVLKDYLKIININSMLYHHEWKGLGSSRNVVVNYSKGKYIVWIDGDMVLDSKDYIKKQVFYMENNPKVGIAKGKMNLSQSPNWITTLELYARYSSGNVQDYNKTTKSLGTGGSIHRISAIKQVKCFNENITGYGEDQDLENRIRKAGWLFAIIPNIEFKDYERYGVTWRELWSRYYKRGYDMFIYLNENINTIKLYKMTPPASIIAGIIDSFSMYKKTKNKIAFLMPINYIYKMLAFWLGYLNARINMQ